MAEKKKQILVVDDDRSVHLAVRYVLRDKYDCISAYNGEEALAVVRSRPVDLVLLDIHMRYEGEGLEYLPRLKAVDSDIEIVVVSANTDPELAVSAVRAGASSCLVKEYSAEQLTITVESALSRRELVRENRHYVRDRSRSLEKNRIIGESAAVRQLMRDIEKVRRSRANVIIVGETGTGKELVARHVGGGGSAPFVAVDSSTITSTMAESILFGHEKGAFTGATSQSKGLFEEADKGSIYFDEIVNMPLEIQAKLLRVIEEKEVTRLGSTRSLPLEFRVICATNKDLEALVKEGRFKDDLYQRLSVITLRIPSLRERREDIPMLLEHFFRKHRYENSASRMSDGATELLVSYSWPGNIRELSNVVANLCAMVADKDVIEAEDLPEKIRLQAPHLVQPAANNALEPGFDFYSYMQEQESRALRSLLVTHGGNIVKMSKAIRMSRSHLYAKLRLHGIQSA